MPYVVINDIEIVKVVCEDVYVMVDILCVS